ncbi:MAG: hypothetical protein CK545_03010, partial [Actinobacteria bacterium]
SLVKLAQGPQKKASATLGLTPGLAGEIKVDADLMTAPCTPALEIYSGVLYKALSWSSLPTAVRKRAEGQLLVISALFGALRPSDAIPAYRLSMDVTLPRVGGLSAFWKKHLSLALAGLDSAPVIDMRSQTYATAWVPNPVNTAQVRVFLEKNGKRTVVSHMAKLTRGEVARELLLQIKAPTSIAGVAEVLSKKFEVEHEELSSIKRPHYLNIILR